ncbi:hypothetical protein FB565_002895 [Actinoplanes lutulentus]|uniref:hypothetical protein n=1 Tax=Actinoplanes lutulentus TaxID=1287878 RepID=UPI000DB987D6|nr:hypothetical protein [Actinoplanes lutulentus]MBB2943182.1 hypothetical protein [Actinoplanes lutulentus]
MTTLIDLDEQPGAEKTPPAGRIRTILAAVALLAVGAALGGLGMHRWQERADASTVSLIMVPDLSGWQGDGVSPAAVADRVVYSVHVIGHMTVINAGPSPVRVEGLSARAAGFTLDDSGWPSQIASHGSAAFGVRVMTECSFTSEQVVATVRLTDAAGDDRGVPVTVNVAPWLKQAKEWC